MFLIVGDSSRQGINNIVDIPWHIKVNLLPWRDREPVTPSSIVIKKYCPWNEIHIYCNSAKLKWVTLETRDTLDEILSGKLWNTRRMLKHVPSPPLKPILEPNPNSRGPTRPGGVSGKNQPTGAEEKVSPAKSFTWGGGCAVDPCIGWDEPRRGRRATSSC